MPFRTEYSLHILYKSGWVTFTREEELEFAPFVGLDVCDNAIGQFTIVAVAWCGDPKMFLCQARLERKEKSLRDVTKMLRGFGWVEDKEARQPLTEMDE